MLWLNSHCFNGLHRESKKSGFNVPRDAARQSPIDVGNIYSVSNELRRLGVTIVEANAVDQISIVSEGTVYADPPYWPKNASSFTAYTPTPFREAEHKALSLSLKRASQRGVSWVLSSSDADGAKKLYHHHGFQTSTIAERRPINSKGTGRGWVDELLVQPAAVVRARP